MGAGSAEGATMELPSIQHEYAERRRRACALMEAQRLDALLVLAGPTLHYFTGLPVARGGSRPWVLLLPRRAPPTLIVHAGRQFEVRALGDIADVRIYTRLSHLPLAELTQAIGEAGVRKGRIGAELG